MLYDSILSVEDVFRDRTEKVITLDAETPLLNAAVKISENRTGVAVICGQDGDVIGVISERDILRTLTQNPNNFKSMMVSQVSTDHPMTCGLKDDIRQVVERMNKGSFRHMPVVEEGKLIGMVSLGHLLSYMVKEADMDRKAFAFSHLEYL